MIFFKNINSFLNFRSRVATLALGHTFDHIMVLVFDFGLYPIVMLYFGIIWGTIIMGILSFLFCLLTMKFYDWSKTDWLGIEALKQFREEEKNDNKFHRALSWGLRKGNFAVLLILSIYKDAFITTAYMRKGAHLYDGMDARDWKIFMSSLFISVIWWSFLANTVITGFRAIFSHFTF